MSDDELQALEALYAKATPGPWERDCDRRYCKSERQHYFEHYVTGAKRDRICTANHVDAQEITADEEGVYDDRQARADLELITALRNAWPALRDAALRGLAQQERDALLHHAAERSLPVAKEE